MQQALRMNTTCLRKERSLTGKSSREAFRSQPCQCSNKAAAESFSGMAGLGSEQLWTSTAIYRTDICLTQSYQLIQSESCALPTCSCLHWSLVTVQCPLPAQILSAYFSRPNHFRTLLGLLALPGLSISDVPKMCLKAK